MRRPGSRSGLLMPKPSSVLRRRRLVALALALATGLVASMAPALAQDTDGGDTTTTTESTTTTEPAVTLPPPVGETTTTTVPPDPDDPGNGEALPEEKVPVVPDTVPPREDEGGGVYAAEAGRLLRQGMHVAEADAVTLETAYR